MPTKGPYIFHVYTHHTRYDMMGLMSSLDGYWTVCTAVKYVITFGNRPLPWVENMSNVINYITCFALHCGLTTKRHIYTYLVFDVKH